MKYLRLLVFVLILSGCSNRPYDAMVRRSAIKFNEKTYFDNFEVDLESWLSYYTWKLKHEGYEAALKVLPDSTKLELGVWELIKTKAPVYDDEVAMLTEQPIGHFYRSCPQFVKYDKVVTGTVGEPELCPLRLYPVTGITYEQAGEFCKWRTKIMGQGKVEFRLPTEEEWNALARKSLPKPDLINGFQDSLNRKGCAAFNYKFSQPCKQFREAGLTNARQIGVGRFLPVKHSILDLFGNVSEMTATKGVAKGGNYRTFAKDCHLNAVQPYSSPEVWLGFRCIAIIKE